MINDFNMYVPIEKIDKEKRTVAGWATTEEIDKQDEVVDYEGSKDAFENWKGNIREMHEPKAVGKSIEMIPNDENKKIWVKAYISKGAEDTWQKVQDGTLCGFSIGGKTLHKTTQIMKEADSNESRTITRITKYQLNELSLVDNPANPSCSFSLVKNIDGTPYQTEIVEDMKKIVITEAEDPLKSEITQHRDKADSLLKKALDMNQLERLSDDDFGVIRKYTTGGVLHKQRFIPMPDKVHAVRALELIGKDNAYNLKKEEENSIHKKAQEILGSAYENYKNLNRGGEDIMSKELVEKLIDQVSKLADVITGLKKDMEGAYKPIPGAKEHPETKAAAVDDPSLGETAPIEGGNPADVDAETQKPEGNYPVKDSEPEKMAKADAQIFELVKGELGENTSNDDVNYVLDIVDYTNKMSDEEFGTWRKSLSAEQSTELNYCLDTFGKAFTKFQKAAHPDESNLETQEEVAAPYKDKKERYPVKKDGADSEGDKYPGKHVAEVDTQTQTSEGKYPVKDDAPEDSGHKVEVVAETKKVAGSENDLSKVVSTLDDLRKKVEDMDKALRKPQPRKYRKIEKSSDVNTEEAELQKEYDEVLKFVQSGVELTPAQEKRRDAVLQKRIDNKFDKSL